jgi:hypothetical protein
MGIGGALVRNFAHLEICFSQPYNYCHSNKICYLFLER